MHALSLNGMLWTIMYDVDKTSKMAGTPTHTWKTMQESLGNKFCLPREFWPDLNPLDCGIWVNMMSRDWCHFAPKFNDHYVIHMCAAWRRSVESVVAVNSGIIEDVQMHVSYLACTKTDGESKLVVCEPRRLVLHHV